jgi:signal transduction histidine kinase
LTVERLRQGLSRLPIAVRIALSAALIIALTAALAVVHSLQVDAIERNVRVAEATIEAYGMLRDLQVQALKTDLAIQRFADTERRISLEEVRHEVRSLADATSIVGKNGRLDTAMEAANRTALENTVAALREAFDEAATATDAPRIAGNRSHAAAAIAEVIAQAAAAVGQNSAARMQRAAKVIGRMRKFAIILGFGIIVFGALGTWLIAASSKFRDDAVAIRPRERERIEGKAKARFAEAVDAMNHGFGLYDDGDRLVLCNQLHRRWTIDGAHAGAGAGAREIELADGTWIRLDEALTPSRYTVRVQTDVSALKRHAHELTAAKEAAETANRVKSEFLANMSHELRTPLNAILGFSEALNLGIAGPATPKQLEYIRDIHASGSHLLEIVNDILDLSKIAAGKLEIAPRPIDLLRVIADSVALVQGRADEAALGIKVDVPADVPLLKADELRLKQILLNLLSNAVKFTPRAGKIAVSARVLDTSLVLSVSDTGIGMRPQDVATALEPFGQVDSKLHRRYAGTGLGLPLVKALVELHGGELHIESAPERGTRVTIRFADYLTRAREAAAA